MSPIITKCNFCSKEIHIRPYKLKIQKTFFCNRSCKANWMSKNLKGKNNSRTGKSLSNKTKEQISSSMQGRIPWNKGKKMCDAHIENNKKSHLGQTAWNKGDTYAKCDSCSKIFHKKLSLIKRDLNHFCNMKCKSDWMSKNLKGKNNPFYENHSRFGIARSEEVKKKIKNTHLNNVLKYPKKYKENGYKAWLVAKKKFRENRKNRKYIYKDINMRSSWEVLVAGWLDKQDLTWFYEHKELDCKELGVYNPDFYVKEWDKYIEVKGFWQQIGLEKFNYWKKKQPDQFMLFNREVLEKIGLL